MLPECKVKYILSLFKEPVTAGADLTESLYNYILYVRVEWLSLFLFSKMGTNRRDIENVFFLNLQKKPSFYIKEQLSKL